MKEKFSTVKEFFAMLREAAIVLLVLFLILFPTAFKNQLLKIGFDKVNLGGMTMDLKTQMNETAQTGNQVAELKQQTAGLKTVIDSLVSKSQNPEERKAFSELAEKTQSILSNANNLDDKVKQQLSVQQKDAEKLNIEVPDEGWIYAGKLKENKTEWDLSITPTIAERNIEFQEGDALTITDDVYIRSNASPLSHANSKVIGVIKAGDKVSYQSKDFSHSIGGGWFLWLKVKKSS